MINCLWCESPNVRNSRLRLADLPRLLLLQWPVRCRSCEERYHVNFLAAWRLRMDTKARRTERRRASPLPPDSMV
jgi:hypothetical protein